MLQQWGSVCLESPLPLIKFKVEVFTNLFLMKGSQVKTNATVTVQMPNIKCSILLIVATTLCGFTANVLDIRGQKYTKKTQIKNISKIQPVKNKFMMIPRMNTMCGNLVRLVKTQSMKLKDTQLHLFMRKKWHFWMLETVLVPFTLKARMRLIFHTLRKLVF